MWGKSNEPIFKNEPVFKNEPAFKNEPGHKPVSLTSPAGDRAHVPAPPPRMTASVGKTTRIRGDVYSEEELYFDGELEGSIEVRHQLTIGPNGKIKANVKAKELVVMGSIQGDVEANDRISIMNGASIVGDVKTAGIVIEDGAYFKGGIDILRPEAAKKEDAPRKPEPPKTPEPPPAVKAVSA